MSYEIVNSLRSKSLVRIVGNTAVNIALSDLASTADETVYAAELAQVSGVTDGIWRIYRANSADPTKLILELPSFSHYVFYEFDISLANGSTSNIHVTNSGTCGTLIMQVTKEATYNPVLTGM